jgi:hypothetical protein
LIRTNSAIFIAREDIHLADRTSETTGKGGAGYDRVSVSLKDPRSYAKAVDWIRDNVVLKRNVKGPVLEIAVSLPDCAVSVFMRPKDHYILAFRGADKVYLLDDDAASDFKKVLEQHVKPTEIETLKGLGAGHGSTGLATFERREDGLRARVFRRQDLATIKDLARYRLRSRTRFEELKKPLSLIVCMIAESARIPMMHRDFVNMYYGCEVIADEAIRSYDDAKYMMLCAREKFPQYPNHLAIEKLAKRAEELRVLLGRIKCAVDVSDRAKLMSDLVKGRVSTDDGSVKQQVKRFRDMCSELSFTDAEAIKQFVSTFCNISAVRAAKQGVAYPNIPA